VTLRLRQTGEGYEYVAEQSSHEGVERPVYVHRLAAIAWSDAETTEGALLDVLGHDVHHEVPESWLSEEEREQRGARRSIPWLNVEAALHPEPWTEHRRRTLSRRVATDGGEADKNQK
jgi:hypothetical protein